MHIILSDFMSLDGVVQAPGGRRRTPTAASRTAAGRCRTSTRTPWAPAIDEVMPGTEALLFGRRTWQAMAAAWPGRAGDPFADRMNDLPKYVASRTLTEDDMAWRLAGSCRPTTRSARSASCGRAAAACRYGAARRSPQLVEHDLVDEYRLMIEPIVLGGGKRLFPDDGAGARSSSSRTQAATGVLICTYRRVRD